jgi:hypothetical protein
VPCLFLSAYIDLVEQRVNSRINFTFDAGTSRATDPYLVITISFIEEVVQPAPSTSNKWELVTCTLGFRKIEGPHTGETYAEMLETLFEEYGILNKVIFILFGLTGNNLTIYLDRICNMR